MTASEDPALDWLERSRAIVDELVAIDRRGRVMLTFMTSHMKETTGALGVSAAEFGTQHGGRNATRGTFHPFFPYPLRHRERPRACRELHGPAIRQAASLPRSSR